MTSSNRLRTILLGAAAACVLIPGCKTSPYVTATISNGSGDLLQQMQMDYPSASFGKDKLPPGDAYVYRFKLQGSGKPHLEFLDSSGMAHSADGPQLEEGQEGTLDIRIAPAYSVSWEPLLRNRQ